MNNPGKRIGLVCSMLDTTQITYVDSVLMKERRGRGRRAEEREERGRDKRRGGGGGGGIVFCCAIEMHFSQDMI